jgi:D-glycero-D-manno-heptose 1,7-bisphosphate phosphatase
MRKAMPFVILDRDGVINYDSVDYIKSPDEWHPIPGSLDAIAALNRAGFQVLVATNQSGIARGLYDIMTLDQIHEKMMHELGTHGGYIDEIFFCPHHPDDHCKCRKPKPGLIHQIATKYPINLAETFFIGDSLVDVQAANFAGCIPLLVSNKEKPKVSIHVPTFENLAKAVEYVLEQRKTRA